MFDSKCLDVEDGIDTNDLIQLDHVHYAVLPSGRRNL